MIVTGTSANAVEREKRILELLARMSLEEKIAQMSACTSLLRPPGKFGSGPLRPGREEMT